MDTLPEFWKYEQYENPEPLEIESSSQIYREDDVFTVSLKLECNNKNAIVIGIFQTLETDTFKNTVNLMSVFPVKSLGFNSLGNATVSLIVALTSGNLGTLDLELVVLEDDKGEAHKISLDRIYLIRENQRG